jgi:hypothetical protein
MIIFDFLVNFIFLMKLQWIPLNSEIITRCHFGAYLGFLDNRII